MAEPEDIRRRRLGILSWRRGIKEMDLILGHYSDDHLGSMTGQTLDAYEALLQENDHDLYQWVTGQTPAPPGFSDMIRVIRDHALARVGPGSNSA